ncbi:MAG: C40 family peptidase [Burkholderiales bacterium]|nr:C40 family peptidase [Burkholderiales bacterium]
MFFCTRGIAAAGLVLTIGSPPAAAWADEALGKVPPSLPVVTPIATVPEGRLARAEKALRDASSALREASVTARDTASEITSYALGLIGVSYKFGGNTPDQGLDCSGLIRYVFQQATGIALPRTARDQARVGESVAMDKLQPGDLVFFNTRRFQFSHVGLYLGDNKFIHAPSRGGSVEVVSLDKQYWQKAFNGARRIIGGLPDLTAVLPAAEASTPAVLSPAAPSSATNQANKSVVSD